jgi:hypothetical protein
MEGDPAIFQFSFQSDPENHFLKTAVQKRKDDASSHSVIQIVNQSIINIHKASEDRIIWNYSLGYVFEFKSYIILFNIMLFSCLFFKSSYLCGFIERN